jgi:hypothetical protein
MLRYRCPQCSQLLQAHELRAGKKSVCVACLTTHIIPIDRSAWLSPNGEPLYPRAPAPAEPLLSAAAPIAAQQPPTFRLDSPPAVEDFYSPEPPEPADVTLAASELQEPPHTPLPASHAHQNGLQSEPTVVPGRDTPRPRSSPVGFPEPAAEPLVEPVIEQLEPVAEEPAHVKTQAEIAAALTEVLTHRMKPPRSPRRDLRISTAGWIVLTAIGVILLALSLFTSANYSKELLAVGLFQVLLGYAWIVWLTANREFSRGLACAIPPFTAYYLSQWKYAKLRPARFVVTGMVLAGLAVLSTHVMPFTHEWVGKAPASGAVAAVDPADLSKLEQLREYRRQRSYDKLVDLLHNLAQTDALKSVDARDGPELALELRALCDNPDPGVKVAAMEAYARWGGDSAREVCLEAIRSQSQEERLMAIKLLPRWKGTPYALTIADAIAPLLSRSDPGVESDRAEAALVEIGGVAAERAVLGVLLRTDNPRLRLITLSILERVGGAETVTALRSYANTSLDQSIKSRTLSVIDAIESRNKSKK